MAENMEDKNVNAEKKEKKKEVNKEIKKDELKEVKKETKKKVEEKSVNEEKNDMTFKKVEMKNSEIKPKHGFLKAVLILIGILVVIYFIFVMRNYMILNDIREKASTYKDTTNYTYQVKGKLGDSSSIYTATRKDDIIRVEIKNEDREDRSIIIWKDLNENEGIISFTSQKTAIIDKADNLISIVSDLPFEFADMNNNIDGISFYTLIYSEEYNGKDCYVLSIGTGYKKWVEKDTGLVMKIESGDNSSTDILSVEINNVSDIYKPDLTGYEIVNKLTSEENIEK